MIRGIPSSVALGLGVVLLACCGRSPLDVPESAVSTVRDQAGADATAQDSAPAGDDVEAMAPPDPCEGMAPVPCPGGGFRSCVAGRYGDCPPRCGICVPGSTRVCFKTYCLRWGTQTCAADGLSFGFCQEEAPPPKCASIADQYKTSPELEQCCIDSGYCCQDLFDLDGDGNYGDMIGSCGGTSC